MSPTLIQLWCGPTARLSDEIQINWGGNAIYYISIYGTSHKITPGYIFFNIKKYSGEIFTIIQSYGKIGKWDQAFTVTSDLQWSKRWSDIHTLVSDSRGSQSPNEVTGLWKVLQHKWESTAWSQAQATVTIRYLYLVLARTYIYSYYEHNVEQKGMGSVIYIWCVECRRFLAYRIGGNIPKDLLFPELGKLSVEYGVTGTIYLPIVQTYTRGSMPRL